MKLSAPGSKSPAIAIAGLSGRLKSGAQEMTQGRLDRAAPVPDSNGR